MIDEGLIETESSGFNAPSFSNTAKLIVLPAQFVPRIFNLTGVPDTILEPTGVE